MSNQDIYNDKDLDLFETHRKSRSTAYIAFFLTGLFGGHRHYLGYGGSGFIQSIMGLTFTAAIYQIMRTPQEAFVSTEEQFLFADPVPAAEQPETLILLGIVSFIILGLWLLIDLFRIPTLTAKKNRRLITRLAAAAPNSQECPTDVIARFAALRANGSITEEEFTACKQQIMGIAPSSAQPATGGTSGA